jgi:hypothetical protein
MSYLFDFNTFYNYYINVTNLLHDPTTIAISYFTHNPRPTISTPSLKSNSNYYITIGGGIIRVYITVLLDYNGQPLPSKNLLFTIPTLINNIYYDNHYHFGLQQIDERTILLNPIYKKIPSIFFHKTIQLPPPLSTGGKNTMHCWFRDNISISKVEDIICTQERSSQIKNKFPWDFQRDVEFISEILSRPFLGILNPGGGGIHIGKRGGKYKIKNGKKIYIKNK